VTPIVRNDGSIHLEFTVSDGSQEDEQTSDNFKTYKVMKTVANSTVVLKNGETLIIGGLNLKTDSVEVSKIPFFGDLPFVGQFFRLEKKNNENRVVDILITTTIIDVDIPQENIFGLNTI
jgi:type II secretory pathway component GspD/PulD (secretin)